MEFLTCAELSEKWGISSRRIVCLCNEGRLEGAIKKGKMWLIPADTEKPVDGRSLRYKDNIKSPNYGTT